MICTGGTISALFLALKEILTEILSAGMGKSCKAKVFFAYRSMVYRIENLFKVINDIRKRHGSDRKKTSRI